MRRQNNERNQTISQNTVPTVPIVPLPYVSTVFSGTVGKNKTVPQTKLSQILGGACLKQGAFMYRQHGENGNGGVRPRPQAAAPYLCAPRYQGKLIACAHGVPSYSAERPCISSCRAMKSASKRLVCLDINKAVFIRESPSSSQVRESYAGPCNAPNR